MCTFFTVREEQFLLIAYPHADVKPGVSQSSMVKRRNPLKVL